MVLAVDVNYKTNYAKSVGVLFNWRDSKPNQIISQNIDSVKEYIPGEFYKRELPCILNLLNQIDISSLECIIVDGYVYTTNEKAFGLGAHLYYALKKKVPIIGLAKKPFFKIEKTCRPIFRGESKKALFISTIDYNEELAFERILGMAGKNRIPIILKHLDSLTKED